MCVAMDITVIRGAGGVVGKRARGSIIIIIRMIIIIIIKREREKEMHFAAALLVKIPT